MCWWKGEETYKQGLASQDVVVGALNLDEGRDN